MRRTKLLRIVGGAAGLVLLATGPTVEATDHNEPQSINAISPDVESDAGDIYGNFAWPTEDSMVFITTFPAPPLGFGYLPGAGPERIYDETHPHAYDDGVLYTTHIDRDLGLLIDRNIVDDEVTIQVRFGYDEANRQWGVMVDGIPGEGRIVGPVNRELRGEGGAKVQAGIFDEPFFVDLERFFEGQQTDHLEFRSAVDFFKGWNVHAIVIEVPKEKVATPLRRKVSVWTSTHRLSNDPFVRPGNVCRD